jgi:hypothetical protein
MERGGYAGKVVLVTDAYAAAGFGAGAGHRAATSKEEDA